jgi:hypothetical protein
MTMALNAASFLSTRAANRTSWPNTSIAFMIDGPP